MSPVHLSTLCAPDTNYGKVKERIFELFVRERYKEKTIVKEILKKDNFDFKRGRWVLPIPPRISKNILYFQLCLLYKINIIY